MQKPVVLLDIDHTILNTDAVKDEVSQIIDANYGQGASAELWKIEKEVRTQKGIFDPKEVAMRFCEARGSENYASVLAAFMEVEYDKYLFPNAVGLLKFLSQNFRLVIFTQGHEIFQRQKVEKLNLLKFTEKIIVSEKKTDLFSRVKSDFGIPSAIIDDEPEVLSLAKRTFGRLLAVQVLCGHNLLAKDGFTPDLATEDLKDVISFLKARFQIN